MRNFIITSQWVLRRLKSPLSGLFAQSFVLVHIKRKYQNSASSGFVRGIHRWSVDSPLKGPVTPKMFPFDDIIMTVLALICFVVSSYSILFIFPGVSSLAWGSIISYHFLSHQMEPFSALLVLCAGNSPVTGEFPAQRPATRSFDVFFDLCLNKRLSKQSRGWLFETLSR